MMASLTLALVAALLAAAAPSLAQEMPVPPRDALAAAASLPDAPPTLSFLKAKPSAGLTGVAMGGDRRGAGHGDGVHAAPGDLGTGGRLRGRAAKRWLSGVLDMPTDQVSVEGGGGGD